VTEARIAARVRHPAVAAVHDLIEHEGSSWMVMDYYPGGTLAALLRDRRTNREAAALLFLSPHTISSHLRHAYVKLGIKSRVELVHMAVAPEAARTR
jgi:serine/threonine protein kinase